MLRAGWALVLALGLATAASAQVNAPPPVLVVNQDALFEQSAYGRSAKERVEAASNALAAENRQIEAALEAEERSLTERRATLSADAFRAEAEAFNAKVEGIRSAQDAKVRSISRMRDEDRQRFFNAAAPVLADLLRERGAVVVLEQSQVVLSLDRIDITAEAIRRVDAQLGTDGTAPETPPPEDPAP